ncbi:MAG TPA: PilZ domain-containing protein [Burkholderiaceae bacterium]|nr:PilZ domain-containing protein [Burkholderiaceae bacterium]
MSQATAGAPGSDAQQGGARPSVISISIKEKAALYAAYMPFLSGGGLFVPTTRAANLGDDLYLILTLMDDPTKLAIPGKIVWITPAGSTGRQQGVGIQFSRNEAAEQARAKIENYIGSALKSSRPTHTI